MSKPIKIDLNSYEIVSSVEELEGFSGLIITPLKFANGMQPPLLYFRKKESNQVAIANPEGVTWHKNIVIATKGSALEYLALVNWYYENLLKDNECRTVINDTFAKSNFDIKRSIEDMKRWLLKQLPSSRKSHLYKFSTNWLNRAYNKHLNYLSSKKGWN